MRLQATQEADPYNEFDGIEIAHDWLRLHYPLLDLQMWVPHKQL
jgi:hypothetical protein